MSLSPSLYLLPHDCKQKPQIFSQVPALLRRLQPASKFPSTLTVKECVPLPVSRSPCHEVHPLQRRTEDTSISLLTVQSSFLGEELQYQQGAQSLLFFEFPLRQEHFPEPSELLRVDFVSKVLPCPFHSQYCPLSLLTSLYVSTSCDTLSNNVDKHPHTLREQWLFRELLSAVSLPWVLTPEGTFITTTCPVTKNT